MFEVGEWSAETSEGIKLVNKLFRNTPKASSDFANASKRKNDGNEGTTAKRKISSERTVFGSSSSDGTLSPKRKIKKKRSKKSEEKCDEESLDFTAAYHLPKGQRKQLLKGSSPLENAADEIGAESETFKKTKKLKRDKKKQKSKDLAHPDINKLSHMDIYSNDIYKKKRTTPDKTRLIDKEISRSLQESPQNVSSYGENDNAVFFTSSTSPVSNFQKKMLSKLEASDRKSVV